MDEFTSRRNALEKSLKDKGDADAAKRIKALKKPTLPAWAINQVAHTEPETVAEFLDVQASLGNVDDRAEFQELVAKRRRLIARLSERAVELLTTGGHAPNPQTKERISTTLLAIASEEEQEALRKGRLEREVAGGGFGFGDALGGLPADEVVAKEPSARAQKAQQEAEDLQHEAQEAANDAHAAMERAARLKRETAAAEREAQGAIRRAEQLEKKAIAAREKAERAR